MHVLSDSQIAAHQPHLSSATSDPVDQIVSWLLSPEVQTRQGLEAGGVVGWSGELGQSGFIYGEITGYYLTFLAFLAATRNTERPVGPAVRLAADWIARNWNPSARPLTRTYLDGRNDRDWRNGFHFSFDLAMMLRGVTAAADFLKPTVYKSARESLAFRLKEFIGPDGQLRPCLLIAGDEPPPTWSVEAGPYQLKGAASILECSGNLPEALRAAARKTVNGWERHLPAAVEFEDLHPLLYFAEGLFLLGFRDKDPIRYRHAETVYTQAFELGGFGEFLSDACARSDVVAQALRLGSILRQLGYLRPPHWKLFLDALADRLVSFCGSDGAVYFRRASSGRLLHANTWSAMFAVQALSAYRSLLTGLPFNPATVQFLV